MIECWQGRIALLAYLYTALPFPLDNQQRLSAATFSAYDFYLYADTLTLGRAKAGQRFYTVFPELDNFLVSTARLLYWLLFLCCTWMQNVLLGRDGRAKVSDVGLAKLLGEEEQQQQRQQQQQQRDHHGQQQQQQRWRRRGGSQPASKPQGGFVGTFTWAGTHGL